MSAFDKLGEAEKALRNLSDEEGAIASAAFDSAVAAAREAINAASALILEDQRDR